MRGISLAKWGLAVLAATWGFAATLQAADNYSYNTSGAKNSAVKPTSSAFTTVSTKPTATSAATNAGASKDAKASAPRDPVAMAFSLPYGTKLNAQQQGAYDKLKRQYESPLRTAVAEIKSSDKNQSAKGLKDSSEVRSKVRSGIKEILAMPAVAMQTEAMRQAYRAEQAAAYEHWLRRSGYYDPYHANSYAAPASSGASGGGACPCGRR